MAAVPYGSRIWTLEDRAKRASRQDDSDVAGMVNLTGAEVMHGPMGPIWVTVLIVLVSVNVT